MKDQEPPPDSPPLGFAAFKLFLAKLAGVPKHEIDEKEAEYQEERKAARKAR